MIKDCKIILVASGKGGVGKSTVSVLLAKSLSKQGKKVGLLDADIYGPSIPTILDIEEKKPELEDGFFIPIEKYGFLVNSIGFLVKTGGALAWRGAMLTKAITQLLYSTKWGYIEYLIIDMPPGTGDAHITISQKAKIFGSVIVTTADKIAIADVERAIDLYKKLNIPIIGIIENMSYIETNGQKIKIFGEDGASIISKKYNLPIIANLPIIPGLSSCKNGYDLEKLQFKFEI